jgi:hypothetical protein
MLDASWSLHLEEALYITNPIPKWDIANSANKDGLETIDSLK